MKPLKRAATAKTERAVSPDRDPTKLMSLLALAFALSACSSGGSPEDDDTGPQGCESNAQCATDAAGPVCTVETGECGPAPLGGVIGWGDGSQGSALIGYIYTPERPLEATDIAFHPDRPNELWVLRREFESEQPCNENQPTAAGCGALEGDVAVVFEPGSEQVSVQTFKDPNAWHFMRRPTALAFGNNGTFATVAEARTGNFLDDPLDYVGPSLWSSDLSEFTVQPPGGNGSHLDMLHMSPFAMGIAHEQDNAHWVFNGQIGSLDRYDFHVDHGPGNDDHSDGEISRYVTGQLTRVPNVPSHMVYDGTSNSLFVADSGAGRVVRLDTGSGVESASPLFPNYDNLVNTRVIDDAILTEVVPPGSVTTPSGLALHEGVLYVTDNATSLIHAFSLDGEHLRSLDTGLPAGSLTAFVVGPDGLGYYVDKPNASVFCIHPY